MNISRIAIAATLLVGLGSIAQAQTRQAEPAATDFYALQTGRSVADEARTQGWRDATVPPSVSHTVMGLSTPY